MTRARSIAVLLAIALPIACDDGSGPASGASTLDITGIPPQAYSGDTLVLQFASPRPVTTAGLAFMASFDGHAIAELSGAAARAWRVRWQLADVDTLQLLRVTAPGLDTTLSVRTRPRIAALALLTPDTVLEQLGAGLQLRVSARTPTGRVVPATGQVEIRREERRLAELPVLSVEGALNVAATGPGTATIVVTADTVQSMAIRVDVRTSQPIVQRVTPERPPAGGIVNLEGLNLSHLGASAVHDGTGAVLPIVTQQDDRVSVQLPSVAPQCGGTSATTLAVDGARTLTPLRLAVARPRDVTLAVGAYQELDVTSGLCLQLGAQSDQDAAYALVMFDTRSITRARSIPQSLDRPPPATAIEVADVSATPKATPRYAGPAASEIAPPALSDVRFAEGAAAATPAGPPPEYFTFRTTPWSAGDRVAVRWDADYLLGTVFRTSPSIAWVTLDRENGQRIPSRLVGLDSAEAMIADTRNLLAETFGVGHPATMPASEQVLVVVSDYPFPGAAHVGNYFTSTLGLGQGVVIWINPGIPQLPLADSLYIQSSTVLHEFAHAYQDRFSMMTRCQAGPPCRLLDGFSAPWALEGNAVQLMQLAALERLGVPFPSNIPVRDILRQNLLGNIWFLQPGALWLFDRGYASSSWLLTQFVARAMEHGASFRDALADVSRGAVEGWVGLQPDGPPATGLDARLRHWVRDTTSMERRVLLEALGIPVDDVVVPSALSHAAIARISDRYPAAASLTTGEGEAFRVPSATSVFAWFQLLDQGRGGSYRIGATPPGWRWAIVRLK